MSAASNGPTPRLGAVVLCGGKSSRMGRAKAFLPFGGEPLLARVVVRIAQVAGPICVVAAPGQEVPPLPPEITIVRDSIAGRGPLQGILAGLSALSGLAGAAFVSSTDAPFLHPDFIRRLEELRAEGDHDIAVPNAGGHYHPLSAVYSIKVRPIVEELLAKDMRRPFFVFERARTRFLSEDDLLASEALRRADPHLWSLRNVNTPEDYEAALRDAGLSG